MLAGNHTPPDVWREHGHLVSLDHFLLDVPPSEFLLHYGIRADRGSPTLTSPGIPPDAVRKLVHPYAFPLLAASLRRLPPALVFTVETDTWRDDGVLYAQRMRADGVRVVHHHKRDAVHGYIGFPRAPLWVAAARDSVEHIANFVANIT